MTRLLWTLAGEVILHQKYKPETILRFRIFLTPRYKLRVADAVIDKIDPIRLKIEDYLKNPEYLVDVLKIGSEKCGRIAEETLVDVKRKVGIGLTDRGGLNLSERDVKWKSAS